MTKRDYELIADSFARFTKIYGEQLKETDNTPEERAHFQGALRGMELVANHLASRLSMSNARFQGVKFLEACGVEKDPFFLIFSNSN